MRQRRVDGRFIAFRRIHSESKLRGWAQERRIREWRDTQLSIEDYLQCWRWSMPEPEVTCKCVGRNPLVTGWSLSHISHQVEILQYLSCPGFFRRDSLLLISSPSSEVIFSGRDVGYHSNSSCCRTPTLCNDWLVSVAKYKHFCTTVWCSELYKDNRATPRSAEIRYCVSSGKVGGKDRM